MDYDEEICNVVSNLLKDGKYDIAISSTYSMCSQLNIDIPLIAFSDLTYNLCTKYLKKTAPKELKERAAAARQSKLKNFVFYFALLSPYTNFVSRKLGCISAEKNKKLCLSLFSAFDLH